MITGQGSSAELEDAFRYLVLNQDVGVLVATLEGAILDANPGALRLTGYASVEELRALRMEALYAQPSVREGLKPTVSVGGPAVPFLLEMRRKDGTRYWAEGHSALRPGRDGGPPTLVSTARDVTDRIRMEQALQASEERYRQVFEHSGTANAIFDTRCRLVIQNTRSAQLLGRAPGACLGMDVEELFGPAKGPAVRERMQRVMATGVAEVFETEFQLPTGAGWFRSSYQPLQDDPHRAVGVQVISQDISAQKAAEAERLRSERRFRSYIENAPVGVMVIDAQGRFREVNAAACRITGYRPEELLELSTRDLAAPGAPPGTQERLAALAHARRVSAEFSVRRKDGVLVPVALDGVALDDTRFLGFVQDISERQRARETLQRSQADLLEAQRIANLGSYTADFREGMWTSSAVLDGIFGIDARYHRSVANWVALVHPEDQAAMGAYLQDHVLGQGKPFDREYRILRPVDGVTRWVHGLGRVEQDAQGHAVRLLGTIQDITERKRSEQALTHEKERLAVTLRSIGDGVITTDTQGRVVLLNNVAERLTGFRQQDAAGLPLAAVFSPVSEEDGRVLPNPAQEVLHSGQPRELANHAVLVSRDGHRYAVADSCAPIKDDGGRLLGTVLVFRDVTERKRLEEGLERSARLESIGVLAGGIAHDFNNLLSGLFGYLELARQDAEASPALRENLDGALKVFARAKALTQQLLTFSKGGAPVRRHGSVAAVVQDAVAFALSGSRVDARVELPADLWPCDFDPEQLAQVVDNIVINAQQAMHGEGTLRVRAANVELPDQAVPGLGAGRHVQVSISDTGGGIPRDIRQRIFDPFFTTKAEGLGLGLATSYSIVRRHNGALDVESEPGRGSTFHVYLPAAAARDAEPRAAPAVVHQGHGRVLLMDDEEAVRITVARMLRRMGHEVDEARHGDQALEMFMQAREAGKPYAALLLDLTIPGGMGGEAVAKGVRAVDARVTLVATSGYSDSPVMAEPARFGFTASVTKPFQMKELAAVLARVTATHAP